MKSNIRVLAIRMSVVIFFMAVVLSAADLTDDQKASYLKQYAPMVWLAKGEEFMPSTVEWAFQYMDRFKNSDGKYWLKTKKPLKEPSDLDLPLFLGNLSTAEVYSYWVRYQEKDYADLVYFFYYPYNRGKRISSIRTVVGNHVSDWEHITVRVTMSSGKPVPTKIYLASHDKGETINWSDIPKTEDGHPIVYSAEGSHGSYKDPGDHVYRQIPLLLKLVDKTSPGTRWDTWKRMQTYDYVEKKGLGTSTWPIWMSSDFSEPGTDPSNPASGPIFRWGNPKDGCKATEPVSGECRLNDGPTGPVSKSSVWDPNILN